MQSASGQFAAPITVPAGIAPSAIAVADVNGDGLPDIIVTDQASGELTVLLNNPQHTFHPIPGLLRQHGTVRPGNDLG